MSITQNLVGLLVFFMGAAALHLFLEKRRQPPSPSSVESRFDVPALSALALRLAQGGMDAHAAASVVATTVADPASGVMTEQDHTHLTSLIAEGVSQLQNR